jgi:Pallilysin beta barrel domain
MKILQAAVSAIGLSLVLASVLCGCQRLANGRTSPRVIVPTVPGEASRGSAQASAGNSLLAPAMPQPRITIDPRDTVLQVINAGLRRAAEEEQVIAVKRMAEVDSPVRLLVVDVDPERGTYYFQSWESSTNATDNRIFSLAVKDLLGEHDLQIVASGMNKDGKLTLDIFRRAKSLLGNELVYKPICQIVADDIHVAESDRPDSYANDPKNGVSFPIETYFRDPDSQNVTDLVKITYQWNSEEGRYVPGAPEKIPGEKAAQAQLGKLFNSTDPNSFEDFLDGSWVDVEPDAAHPGRERYASILSFDPRQRKIAVSSGDTQEVYTWRVTARTIYNSAYLIGDNETVPQISRTFIVTATSAVTLSIAVQGNDSPDRPPVTYTRISDELQAKLLARPGAPASLHPPNLEGEYSGPKGLSLDFQNARLQWKDSGRTRSAEYVLFPLSGRIILTVRFLEDNRASAQDRSWTVDFKEVKDPSRILRTLTLSPVQLTVRGYEDAVGDTISVQQEVPLRAR